jgi:hypothetical protein
MFSEGEEGLLYRRFLFEGKILLVVFVFVGICWQKCENFLLVMM